MLKTINGGKEPTRATKYSAGIDLYSNADTITLIPSQTVIIPLGVCIDSTKMIGGFKESHYIALHPRSSLRVKGLMANTGIIDLDFTKEIGLILTNTSTNFLTIDHGQRIAQVVLMPHMTELLQVSADVERTGGFGSTGK